MQAFMNAMLRIQAKICYGTSLVILAFSLWHFINWMGAGAQVEYEKAIVLAMLSIGVFIVGWVVKQAVEEDTEDSDTQGSRGPSVDF